MENNNQTFSPKYAKAQHKRQDKDNENLSINPDFSGLNNPDTIQKHLSGLKKTAEATPHTEILQQLIKQFEPLDFEKSANPHGTENFKLSDKYFVVLSVENALLIAKKNNWGLCKNHDFIYLYNGAFWTEIEKQIFQKFLGEAAEQMGVPKFSARYFEFRDKLFKQFLAAAYLPTPEADRNTVLINLKNGTFKVSPQETNLKPFDRTDFLTYQLPFEYNPKAEAPIFKKYLNRVLPDLERQKVLAEYLGFVFIKHGNNSLKEEKALILYGTGANGKSVFFEIVNALLGTENVSSFSLQSLTDNTGYFRAKLANKLVNYASEINGKLETAIFKQLVSGEPVEARLPYGQPFTLTQYAKLIFNVNELPKDVEHTNAYFRRFLIIPFDVTIPDNEQDKNLHTKIIENELSGVFNWVLEGLNRLLKQKKFSDCEAAKQAIEQYKTESNSVQMFLNENDYRASPTYYRLIKELYPEYRAFCYDDGITPFKKVNFIRQMKGLGFVVDRVSGNQLAAFVEAPGTVF